MRSDALKRGPHGARGRAAVIPQASSARRKPQPAHAARGAAVCRPSSLRKRLTEPYRIGEAVAGMVAKGVGSEEVI